MGGSLEKKHGKRWEKYIRKECDELRRRGVADVDKNWEAPTIPGGNVPREPSKPDFSGVLAEPAGRHVVFEAKSTLSETSFPFANIADHQAERLSTADAWGAVSFVYILDGQKRKWVVPWGEVERCRHVVDRKSFPFSGADWRFRKQDGETWLERWRKLEMEGLV